LIETIAIDMIVITSRKLEIECMNANLRNTKTMMCRMESEILAKIFEKIQTSKTANSVLKIPESLTK